MAAMSSSALVLSSVSAEAFDEDDLRGSVFTVFVIDHWVAEVIHVSACFPYSRVHEDSGVDTTIFSCIWVMLFHHSSRRFLSCAPF